MSFQHKLIFNTK